MVSLANLISNAEIKIIVTPQLITELKEVASPQKLKKYFSSKSVSDLIDLLDIISENVEIEPTHFFNRDPKDNFLLDLIDFSKADYLVTGDKDLLEHGKFKTARIVTSSDFESLIESK